MITALIATAALASCVDQNEQRSEDAVATVGRAAEVTVAEIKARLPAEDTGPPVLRPGVDPPDAWRDALRLAIRDELLSLEAARRDPAARWAQDPAGRAARIRAVTDQERARLPELQASNITDAEARSWFEHNHGRFDEIESTYVTWASFTDGGRARAVLNAVPDLKQVGFLRLSLNHGASTGTAVLDSSGRGADALVARVAFATREAGSVGMVADADQRWWLVRIDSVQLTTPPWNDQLAGRVRAAMAWEREQSHLDTLAEQLKTRWPVTIDEQRFEASRP